VIDEPLHDDQFVLQQPPGTELVNLDEQHPNGSSNAPPAPADSNQPAPKK
jgi:hypothetical protein